MGSKELDRRSFLRKTVLGTTGVLMTSSVFANSQINADNSDDKPIIKRKLGNTGIVLPIVSFGVMKADSPALLQAALSEGIIHFDTAHGYQNGRNEEMIGEVFKDVKRDLIVLSTKVVPEDINMATGKLGPGSTSKAFLNRLDISLKRLKKDYVDILYVHALGNRDGVLFPEMLEAVTRAKKEGKAKHVGVSTHRNEPEVIRAAIESKIFEVVLTSINFKMGHFADLKKAIAEAANAGIGIVAMKTMAGGFVDKERKIPVNCKAALKFVMQDENISTSIPGITNFDHLKENSSVNRDLVMTEKEKADTTVVSNPQGGLYCQGCETCMAKCSKKLPIPDLMRAYMYAYGYNNGRQAYELLTDLRMSGNPCGDCKECNVVCAKNFAVAERITDVMRLTTVPQEFLA
jgi:uncharacterized protein